jgi:hypothetical protein
MDRQAVKEWQAGFERHHRLEVEERRRATFSERLRALNMIVRFARRLPLRPQEDDLEAVRLRWQRIRERYGKPH